MLTVQLTNLKSIIHLTCDNSLVNLLLGAKACSCNAYVKCTNGCNIYFLKV